MNPKKPTLYKFSEILNDLMDYFILGDAEYLLQYRLKNSLPEDLLTEFTTLDTGDVAIEQGVFVPMCGVNPDPHTIYFNLSDETPELLKPQNQLQHRKDGYCLRVENGKICLYTMPYLREYTEKTVENLKKNRTAAIKIPNGWYSVAILAGLTSQTSEWENKKYETLEPTFEFLIKRSSDKPRYSGDFLHRFEIIKK